MTKTTDIIVTTEQPQSAEPPKPNPFPFFPNFNFNFNLQQLPFPFFQPKRSSKEKEEEEATIISESKQLPTTKRNLVSFPNTQVVVPPPLQAEPDPADISNTKTSNPFIIWQVYAIAGFMVSRWIWAKWNESKGRGKSPNDDRHSDDGRGDYE